MPRVASRFLAGVGNTSHALWAWLTTPFVLAAVIMFGVGLLLLVIGVAWVGALWGEGMSRAVSEAGVGLIAAGVVTFVAEPLAHRRLDEAVRKMQSEHEDAMLEARMTPAVYHEFRSSIVDQHFRRTGFSFHVRLVSPIPEQESIPERAGYIQKLQRTTYYVFNLERGRMPYVLHAFEELYNRFTFLHGSRITWVEVVQLNTDHIDRKKLPHVTADVLKDCTIERRLFHADESRLSKTMTREDLDTHPTAIAFKKNLPIGGHTWLRITTESTSFLAERGSTPLVMTTASDGMTLTVVCPPSLHVETDALCTVDAGFPYERGHSYEATPAAHTKVWSVTGGLLPMQGLELMWYPITDKEKYLVRRVWYHGWTKRRFDLIPKYVSEDYSIRETGTTMQPHVGAAALVELISAYHHAFAGLEFIIDDQVVDGDRVETTWHVTGRHMGEFRGIAPTGKDLGGLLRGRTESKVDVLNDVLLWDVVHWNYSSLLDLLRASGNGVASTPGGAVLPEG
jgi:SnoaL-like polyketide cyclase